MNCAPRHMDNWPFAQNFLAALLAAPAIIMMNGCGGDAADVVSSTADEHNVKITVSLAPSYAEIAEPVRLTLSATAPSGTHLVLPEFNARLGELFIVDTHEAERVDLGGSYVEQRSWTLESYAPGQWSIPSLEVNVHTDGSNEEEYVLRTQPLELSVKSAVAKFANPQKFHDIAGVVALRRRWWYWAAWISGAIVLGSLLIAIGVAGGRKFLDRISPVERARRRLDDVDRKRLQHRWDAERVVTEASLILRRYLQEKFRIDAPRLTTEECLRHAAETTALTQSQQTKLQTYLQRDDRTKFAQTSLSLDESRAAIEETRRVISDLEASQQSKKWGREEHR